MNLVKAPHRKQDLHDAVEITTRILRQLYDATKAGVSAADIDELAGKLCAEEGVIPSFYGVDGEYVPFDYNICISVNEVILHGIPHAETIFKPGDIVKLDFGIIYRDTYTDQCVTFILEPAAPQDLKLVEVSRMAVLAGTKQAVPGKRTGDIGHAIYSLVKLAGFDVLKEFIGHGVGDSLHESPEIPAYGQPGKGTELKEGDVICVEAQVVSGSDDIFIGKDGWSVVSSDGKKGAMFEYMVIVGQNPEILSSTFDWPIVKV